MEITINELCAKLEKKLLLCTCLTGFYVGETDNMDETIERHKNEGYNVTQQLATASHTIIAKAEEQLIAYFKKSILKERFRNKSDNSVGSKTANSIYVSIMITPKCINELDDDDINWSEVYKLKE